LLYFTVVKKGTFEKNTVVRF